jgi:hypothetical protein
MLTHPLSLAARDRNDLRRRRDVVARRGRSAGVHGCARGVHKGYKLRRGARGGCCATRRQRRQRRAAPRCAARRPLLSPLLRRARGGALHARRLRAAKAAAGEPASAALRCLRPRNWLCVAVCAYLAVPATDAGRRRRARRAQASSQAQARPTRRPPPAATQKTPPRARHSLLCARAPPPSASHFFTHTTDARISLSLPLLLPPSQRCTSRSWRCLRWRRCTTRAATRCPFSSACFPRRRCCRRRSRSQPPRAASAPSSQARARWMCGARMQPPRQHHARHASRADTRRYVLCAVCDVRVRSWHAQAPTRFRCRAATCWTTAPRARPGSCPACSWAPSSHVRTQHARAVPC